MSREERSFIVLADDWGRHVSTAQHLFRAVSRHHDVLWVNSYGHRRPRLSLYDLRRAASKAWRMIGRASPLRLLSDGDPVAIVEPRALPWHNVTAIHRLNTITIARQIRHAAAAAIPDGERIFVTTTPIAVDIIGTIGEAASIYLCMDDYDVLPGVESGLLVPFEQRLVLAVDGTVATAQSLLASRTPPTGLAMQLPQGVNFEHFAKPLPQPVELDSLPRPLLGFAGGVGPAIDWPLIRKLSVEHSEGTVVLIGMLQDGAALEDMPSNVRWLGPKAYADLPAFVQAFDVALVPYVINRHTIAVDPLKLLEYLAAGVQVVSTDLPEARKYASQVAVCATHADFLSAAHLALRTRDPSRSVEKQDFARRHTWSARADEFLAFIDRVMAARHRHTSPRTGVP